MWSESLMHYDVALRLNFIHLTYLTPDQDDEASKSNSLASQQSAGLASTGSRSSSMNSLQGATNDSEVISFARGDRSVSTTYCFVFWVVWEVDIRVL